MARYAIIENGVVDNIINANEAFAATLPNAVLVADGVEAAKGYEYDSNTDTFTKVPDNVRALQNIRRGVVDELRNIGFLMDEMPQQQKAAWIAYRQQLIASARAANAAQNPDLFSWPDKPSDDPVSDLL